MQPWVQKSSALALAALLGACSTPALNRDRHGPSDVEGYIESLESPERRAELEPERAVAELALAPSAWVADLGCGPGVFTLAFARALPQGVVFAVDIEPRQLDRLREHVREEHFENVVPVLASVDTPHLPPGKFDLIFIGETYHHFEDRVVYMRALRRALRSGGRLAVLESKPGRGAHKVELEPGEMEDELRAAGWQLDVRFDSHADYDYTVWSPAS
jgi:SAM-dependent methyltransferase